MLDPDLLNELQAIGFVEKTDINVRNNVHNNTNDSPTIYHQEAEQQKEGPTHDKNVNEPQLPPPPPYESNKIIQQPSEELLLQPPPYAEGKPDVVKHKINKKEADVCQQYGKYDNQTHTTRVSLLEKMEVEMIKYKQKALECKKLGNLKQAKSNYSNYKKMKAMLEAEKTKSLPLPPSTTISIKQNTANLETPSVAYTKPSKAKERKQQQPISEKMEEVKLTPDDMNDPELLAELQMLQGGSDKLEGKNDINKLKAEMKVNQVEAVKARRGGDLKLARKYFLEYKRIKTLIQGYGQ